MYKFLYYNFQMYFFIGNISWVTFSYFSFSFEIFLMKSIKAMILWNFLYLITQNEIFNLNCSLWDYLFKMYKNGINRHTRKMKVHDYLLYESWSSIKRICYFTQKKKKLWNNYLEYSLIFNLLIYLLKFL